MLLIMHQSKLSPRGEGEGRPTGIRHVYPARGWGIRLDLAARGGRELGKSTFVPQIEKGRAPTQKAYI